MFASVVFFGLVALVGARPVNVQIGSATVDEARISDLVNAAASYLHFFLVPVFAGLVMLLFGRRRYYVEHLVFALHFGAFAFLGLVVFGGAARAASGGPAPSPAGSAIMAAWTVALVAYLLIALRRVYGRPWGGTVLRAGALGILYAIAFAIGMALVTAVVWWIV